MNELLQLEVGEVGGQYVGLDLLLDILPHPPSPILQLLHHVAAVERRLHHLACICGRKGVHGDKSSGHACSHKENAALLSLSLAPALTQTCAQHINTNRKRERETHTHTHAHTDEHTARTGIHTPTCMHTTHIKQSHKIHADRHRCTDNNNKNRRRRRKKLTQAHLELRKDQYQVSYFFC